MLSAVSQLDRVVVVLGAYADEILERVPLHGAEPVVCAEWRAGQSASLRAGLEALAGCDAAVVVLGDQPRVTREAVERVVAARSDGAAPAVRATYGGVPGHPVLLERALFRRVAELRGDEGARGLLHGARHVPCDGLGSPLDVDTPADLA